MNSRAIDLAQVGAGFHDPVLDSQRAYRRCLDALSRPGTLVPAGEETAATSLLLALLDQDTRLWLSPSLAGGAAESSLRFHTGCALAASPAEADFALIASPQEMPALESFSGGTDEHPERSATLVLQVAALQSGTGWRLSGPGIKGELRLRIEGLDADFVAQWEANHARFPRGVDLFLCSGAQLCGLPRTTKIEA